MPDWNKHYHLIILLYNGNTVYYSSKQDEAKIHVGNAVTPCRGGLDSGRKLLQGLIQSISRVIFNVGLDSFLCYTVSQCINCPFHLFLC